MKSYLFKLSTSLLLVTVTSFSFCQTIDDLHFDKKVQKFMKVDEGHQITLSYSFSYSGDLPLNIIPPKVDCSCTEVILPEDKIKPNSTNKIEIKFDTKDKIGYQEREVLIQFTSDAMDSRSIEVTLIFKGVIKASKATKEAYKNNN